MITRLEFQGSSLDDVATQLQVWLTDNDHDISDVIGAEIVEPPPNWYLRVTVWTA